MKLQYLIVTSFIITILSFHNSSIASGLDTDKAKVVDPVKPLVFGLKYFEGRTQKLTIEHISEEQTQFKLEMKGICKRTISGVAKKLNDNELVVDGEGARSPAVSYEYKGQESSVTLYIATSTTTQKRDKAAVGERDYEGGCRSMANTMILLK